MTVDKEVPMVSNKPAEGRFAGSNSCAEGIFERDRRDFEMIVKMYFMHFVEDRCDRKSNTGFVYYMNEGLVSWCSKKQDIVAQSSTEAEYVAISETRKEILWIRQFLKDFDIEIQPSTLIFTDNQGCIKNN